MDVPPAIVYGLVDPRTKLVRYVGKTTSGVSRYHEHLHPRGFTRNACWVRRVLKDGLAPELVVLEVCPLGAHDTLVNAERWWIAYGRLSGWPLNNHTDGGEGSVGYKHPPAARARMSVAGKGRPKSEQHRRKIGEANRRRWADPAKRQIQSQKLKGRTFSMETVEKMRAARRRRAS